MAREATSRAEELRSRLSDLFVNPNHRYTDSEVDNIQRILEQLEPSASKSPRIYIILRNIDRLDLLDDLLGQGFDDLWLPVETPGLPPSISPRDRTRFVAAQASVLSSTPQLEQGRHCNFSSDDALPFDIKHRLGVGAYSQVDKIQSRTSHQVYALKRVRRRNVFGKETKEALEMFTTEANIVKRIHHTHMVKFIGSYTDKKYLGIIMSPVADMDLAVFLKRTCSSFGKSATNASTTSFTADMGSSLRSFFGCLAAALTYLHDKRVRHKDIKPSNILVSQGTVLFTDFGLSRQFTDEQGSTTSGSTALTPRYCAPEVAAYDKRNTSADIWSLGCVYFEMISALLGYDIDWLRQFFISTGTKESFYSSNMSAFAQLADRFRTEVSAVDHILLDCVRGMTTMDPSSRLHAAQVYDHLTQSSHPDHQPTTFCGICCSSISDSDSDSVDDEPFPKTQQSPGKAYPRILPSPTSEANTEIYHDAVQNITTLSLGGSKASSSAKTRSISGKHKEDGGKRPIVPEFSTREEPVSLVERKSENSITNWDDVSLKRSSEESMSNSKSIVDRSGFRVRKSKVAAGKMPVRSAEPPPAPESEELSAFRFPARNHDPEHPSEVKPGFPPVPLIRHEDKPVHAAILRLAPARIDSDSDSTRTAEGARSPRRSTSLHENSESPTASASESIHRSARNSASRASSSTEHTRTDSDVGSSIGSSQLGSRKLSLHSDLLRRSETILLWVETGDGNRKYQTFGEIPLLVARCGSVLKDAALLEKDLFTTSESLDWAEAEKAITSTTKAPQNADLLQNHSPKDFGFIWMNYFGNSTTQLIPRAPQELWEAFSAGPSRITSHAEKIQICAGIISDLSKTDRCTLLYFLDVLAVLAKLPLQDTHEPTVPSVKYPRSKKPRKYRTNALYPELASAKADEKPANTSSAQEDDTVKDSEPMIHRRSSNSTGSSVCLDDAVHEPTLDSLVNLFWPCVLNAPRWHSKEHHMVILGFMIRNLVSLVPEPKGRFGKFPWVRGKSIVAHRRKGVFDLAREEHIPTARTIGISPLLHGAIS